MDSSVLRAGAHHEPVFFTAATDSTVAGSRSNSSRNVRRTGRHPALLPVPSLRTVGCVRHLLHHAPHRVGNLAARLVVGAGRPGVQPRRRRSPGWARKSGHGRRDGELLLGEVARPAPGQRSPTPHARTCPRLTTAPLERQRVGVVGDWKRSVAASGSTSRGSARSEHDKHAFVRALTRRHFDDQTGSAGGRDEQIRLSDRRKHLAEPDRASTDAARRSAARHCGSRRRCRHRWLGGAVAAASAPSMAPTITAPRPSNERDGRAVERNWTHDRAQPSLIYTGVAVHPLPTRSALCARSCSTRPIDPAPVPSA